MKNLKITKKVNDGKISFLIENSVFNIEFIPIDKINFDTIKKDINN